jgi:imidazoleglycerol phosphate synthase glutamine amidotransferase subunit HisH
VAFQFHPERSGHKGINIYRRLRRMAEASRPAGANP